MTSKLAVESYLGTILTPQLDACGLNPAQQTLILEDVRGRLDSLLAHWQDLPLLRTVLLLGLEEASFYEPSSADLRCALVNVAVRNSLVEDLAASKTSLPELSFPASVLSDTGMAGVTRAAIEFFQKCRLDYYVPPSLAQTHSVYCRARIPHVVCLVPTGEFSRAGGDL